MCQFVLKIVPVAFIIAYVKLTNFGRYGIRKLKTNAGSP